MRLRFAIALLAIATVPREAFAYCRTTTNNASFVPTAQKPCDDTGKPLFWAGKCLTFSMQKDASKKAPLEQATDIMTKAFAAWTNVSCGACNAAGSPSMTISHLGPVTCGEVEYNSSGGNQNVIVFRDTRWPHSSPNTTLALTTVAFNTETGEIYDADLEVNSQSISVGDTNVSYDLQSILTHEAGHFLGLAHTQPSNTQSTMFARYDQGQTFMRDLAPDDVCGVCEVYPPNRNAACDGEPRHGFASECGGKTDSSCGCGVAPSSSLGFAWIGLAGLVAFVRRRCARR